MKVHKKEILNIPNIISIFRILLIPVFILTYTRAKTASDCLIAAGVLLLSGVTDLLDGFIARKYNMITELGKGLDPVADKLSQAAIVTCLMFKIRGMFILFIIFMVKELFMAAACLFLLKRGQKMDGAKWFGKVSTAIFYCSMFIMIIIPSQYGAVQNILMFVSGIFLLLAFVLYAREFWRMYKKSKGDLGSE